MAQVVLRKPACHSTAKSNSPSTRITAQKLLTDSQANNPPLERGSKRCGQAEEQQVDRDRGREYRARPAELLLHRHDHHAGRRPESRSTDKGQEGDAGGPLIAR